MSSTFWIVILFILLSVAVGYAWVQHNKESQFNINRLDYDGLQHDGIEEEKAPYKEASGNTNKYNEVFAKAYSGPAMSNNYM